MKMFLRSVGLEILEFNDVRNAIGGAPFIGNIIAKGVRDAKATVVLFSPDEVTWLHPSLAEGNEQPGQGRWSARPNVLIEAGMALATDDTKTLLVSVGQVDMPSDLQGRHVIRMTNDAARRVELKDALTGVRCELRQGGTDFLDTNTGGDFEACVQPPSLAEVTLHNPFEDRV